MPAEVYLCSVTGLCTHEESMDRIAGFINKALEATKVRSNQPYFQPGMHPIPMAGTQEQTDVLYLRQVSILKYANQLLMVARPCRV